MDDSLLVDTRISGIGGASIEMNQAIRRGQGVLLTAKVRVPVVSGGKARHSAGSFGKAKGDRAAIVWS
jgi:acyl-CoA thioesterase FadM